jgi:1,2-diacylglycerol 3-alpha-glucosyltransferase
MNIGRIAPEKSLGMLLESFQFMLEHVPAGSLKLMIVGEGPDLTNLISQAADLGLGEQVIFTGLVAPDEVPNYLAAADLFVMTSTSEVKPLAQLEALAAGVPIVSVAAAGANDTIIHDHNGLLVPTKDPRLFGTAVLELIVNELKHRSFCKAAQQTAERYAYPKITAEYLELFKKSIEKRGAIS